MESELLPFLRKGGEMGITNNRTAAIHNTIARASGRSCAAEGAGDRPGGCNSSHAHNGNAEITYIK